MFFNLRSSGCEPRNGGAGMSKQRKDGDIEIVDEQPFEGRVFRVARFERGACKESLWCRVELIPAGGYGLSFFRPHGKEDALRGRDPLIVVPVHLADLAAIAFKKLQEMQEARDKAQLAAFTGIPY